MSSKTLPPSVSSSFCTPETLDPSRVIVKAAVPKEVVIAGGQKITYYEMALQYNSSVDGVVRPVPFNVQFPKMESSGIQKSKFGANRYQMKLDFMADKPEDEMFVKKMEEIRNILIAKIKEVDADKTLKEIFFYPKAPNKSALKTGWKKISWYVRMKSYTDKETGRFVFASKFLYRSVDRSKKSIDDWTTLTVDKAKLVHEPLINLSKINLTASGVVLKAEHVSSIVHKLATPTQNEIQEALMDADEMDDQAVEDAKAMEAFLTGTKTDSSAPSMFGPEVKQSSPSSLPPPPSVTDSLKGLTVIPPATSSPPAPAVPPSLPGLTPLPPGLTPLPPK